MRKVVLPYVFVLLFFTLAGVANAISRGGVESAIIQTLRQVFGIRMSGSTLVFGKDIAWGSSAAGAPPTLDEVTDAGSTTTNAISVKAVEIDTTGTVTALTMRDLAGNDTTSISPTTTSSTVTLGAGNNAFTVADGAAGGSDLLFTAGRLEAPTLSVSSSRTARLEIKHASAWVATTSGATVTTTDLVPAGCRIIYVVGRVTTAVTTSSATNTFSITFEGDGDADRLGAAIAGALGTTFDEASATADPMSWSNAAQDVVLDAAGAETFTAGAVRITAFYLDPSPPGS